MRNILIGGLLLVSVIAYAQSPAVPSQKELKALAAKSMGAFNNAVQAKDFTAFHKQISATWRDQVTPAKLKSIFETFIEQEIDFGPVLKLDPEFGQPPAIDADGVLVVEGRYPSRPSAVRFRLKYVQEKSAWKLLGIKVEVKGTDVPSEREARALALESLLAFNRAVQAKNFTTFHKQIADVWRKQITPEELKKAFAPFTEQDVNIASIADHQPVFEPAPGFDADDLLLLQGHYPTRPNKLEFKLRYIQEADAWQLVSIAVNVGPEGDNASDEKQED
jgi:Arc/MetJ-type ribon-helix-helix transcriptional regulator